MGEKLPFLDKTGVIRLWQHIVAKLGVKADRSELEALEEVLIQQIENIDLSGYETIENAAAKLVEAKEYTDSVKNDLLNGAGEAYDTLKELGDLIDENTDALDALEILASKQSDWSQNDESAPDYVKNRTHWVEAGKKIIISEITSVNGQSITDSLSKDCSIQPEQTYIVTVDGIPYTCTAWSEIGGINHLGDSRLLGEDSLSYDFHPEDVPFVVMYEEYWPEDLGAEVEIYCDVHYSDLNSHAIKIEQYDESFTTYHKLDENFIPDTIARVTQIVDGVYYGSNSDKYGFGNRTIIIDNFPFTLKEGLAVAIYFQYEIESTGSGSYINITPDAAFDQSKDIYDQNNNPYTKTIPAGSLKMLIYDGAHWRIEDTDISDEILITTDDIDTICGASIKAASEVTL